MTEEQYWADRAEEGSRPSNRLRPKLTRDGDQWCALYGSNLMEGVAGFGSSPDKAMRAFDIAFTEDIATGASRRMT